LHRELDPLADLLALHCIAADGAHLADLVEQQREIAHHELIAEGWIVTRARKIVIGDQADLARFASGLVWYRGVPLPNSN